MNDYNSIILTICVVVLGLMFIYMFVVIYSLLSSVADKTNVLCDKLENLYFQNEAQHEDLVGLVSIPHIRWIAKDGSGEWWGFQYKPKWINKEKMWDVDSGIFVRLADEYVNINKDYQKLAPQKSLLKFVGGRVTLPKSK